MAKITYNGVTIPYLTTRGCQDTVVMTEDNADYKGTDHEIFVEGVIYATTEQLAGDWYTSLRHSLEQPRKTLTYEVNGATIVESSAELDINNGPHPKVISITRVLGSEAIHVAFRVVTRLWGCDGNLPAWISNRWEETQDIDSEFLSTLTRTGKLYFARDRKDTDKMRGIITPPIQRGFTRVRATYTMQSDGLAMRYTFQDREVEYQAPAPAIKIDDATYTETSPNGAIRYGEVRVALTGEPRGDRKALLTTAILIGVRRMQAAGAMRVGWVNPVVMSLSEQLHRNKVNVRIQTMLNTVVKEKSSLPAAVERTGNTLALVSPVLGDAIAAFGKFGGALASPPPPATPVPIPSIADLAGWGLPPHGSNPEAIPDPGKRGASTGSIWPLTLVAAALNDPCLAFTGSATPATPGTTPGSGGGSQNPGSGGSQNPVPATVNIVQTLPPELSDPKPESFSLYTDCRILCRWEQDEHIAHCAVTDETGLSVFIPYASPTMQLHVMFTAERVGGKPSIPPKNIGPNFVLLGHDDPQPELGIAADGATITVRASGHRVYGVVNPSQVVKGAAVPPWVLDQLTTLSSVGGGQTASALKQLLLAASSAGSGSEDAGILPWAAASQQPAIG